MTILAIETSTDETAVCLVRTASDGAHTTVYVLGDALASQAALHNEYGGVYPSLAKREHSKNLVPLLTRVLTQAGSFEPAERPDAPKETIADIKEMLEREPELFVQLAMLLAQIQKPEIDAIAVTQGPGLEPALWVGVNFARALSHAWNVPVMPINHMEGHIAAALFERGGDSKPETQRAAGARGLRAPAPAAHYTLNALRYPALALLISGGHTELVLVREGFAYTRIGKTRDDAVGEAFDKSARLLGLPYPGGPEISKLAHEAREYNLAQPYSLPRPMLDSSDLDFSFSGLKTAVRNLVQDIGTPSDEQKRQIARELEDAITDTLIAKTRAAIDEHGVHTLIVSGGVSANTHIRTALTQLASEYGDVSLYIPTPTLSTDNGLMIAFAAAMRGVSGADASGIRANGNLTLDGTKRKL